MDTLPYRHPREHLLDAFEGVRLALMRYIVRYWHRITNAAGGIEGLYVSLEEVRRGIGHAPGPPAEAELPRLETIEEALAAHRRLAAARVAATLEGGQDLPLENLRFRLALEPEEVALVLLLAALQLDVGLHRLATYGWADFSQKAPSLGFAAEVIGARLADAERVMALGDPDHRLRRLQIVRLGTGATWNGLAPPPLHAPVALSDRVVDYLWTGRLGAAQPAWDGMDAVVRVHAGGRLSVADLGRDAGEALQVTNAVRMASRYAARQAPDGGERAEGLAVPIVVMTGGTPQDQRDLVRAAVAGQRPVIEVTVTQPERAEEQLAWGLREAALREGVPWLWLDDVLSARGGDAAVIEALRRVLPAFGGLTFVSVSERVAALERLLGPHPRLLVRPVAADAREALWRAASEGIEGAVDLPGQLGSRYSLAAADIRAAADDVRFSVALANLGRRRREPPAQASPADFHGAVRRRIHHRLGTLAERFSTPLEWGDLILDDDLTERLREMVSFGRHARQVHDVWGFGRISGYGRALTALFAGPPGTGKTVAAAILAKELGAELFKVDLSRVVDKYVGETEKNLGRVFDEAEASRAVLLFDEADSLFGQRTSVSSSNDRYANLEVNYLLQRMEHFNGTSILTSNFAESIDSAFKRRLQFKLEFKLPEAEERERIWRVMMPPTAPLSGDIHFAELGRSFEMSPGHIKNAVLRAAFRAADRGCGLTHALVVEAATVEYRELGRVVRSKQVEPRRT